MSTSTLEQVDTRSQTQPTHGGEPPRQSHIVWPKDKLVDAMVLGTPVTALCGHTFVPGRNPAGLPVCQGCKEAFEAMHGPLGDDVQ